MRLTQDSFISGHGISCKQESTHGQGQAALCTLKAVGVEHDVEFETHPLGRVDLLMTADAVTTERRPQLATHY